MKKRADTWPELMQFEHSLEQFWAAYTEACKMVLCLNCTMLLRCAG
jgi:hypothetical protein